MIKINNINIIRNIFLIFACFINVVISFNNLSEKEIADIYDLYIDDSFIKIYNEGSFFKESDYKRMLISLFKNKSFTEEEIKIYLFERKYNAMKELENKIQIKNKIVEVGNMFNQFYITSLTGGFLSGFVFFLFNKVTEENDNVYDKNLNNKKMNLNNKKVIKKNKNEEKVENLFKDNKESNNDNKDLSI